MVRTDFENAATFVEKDEKKRVKIAGHLSYSRTAFGARDALVSIL